MYRFLLSMKQPAGGFAVHESGCVAPPAAPCCLLTCMALHDAYGHARECDVRATYTALAVASGLNLLTPELIAGTADHLLG